MYGAGNIGRGFIGQSFSAAGYKVGFVDINKEVISRLNADKEYPVNVVTSDKNEEITVKNVYGIDGTDAELVSEEIATCDMMATAIGVNVLKFIAKPPFTEFYYTKRHMYLQTLFKEKSHKA